MRQKAQAHPRAGEAGGAQAARPLARPTICLNMIVKNEAHIIRRCLESVRRLIDHWVIVYTGSTDGTQDLVRQVLTDIPGELHEQSWRDFSHNRTQALLFAAHRADYPLFIDADETRSPPRQLRLNL